VTPLLGFTPDASVTSPGVIADCEGMIPCNTGMEAAPTPSAYADALAAKCLGAATLTKLDGTRRVFAGTSTKLYELSGTTWTDVSRVGDYALGAETRWSFTQFGDTSVLSSIDNVIQTSSSGAFADQATAPQAAIVEAVLSSGGGFVFAFNTIDATYGTSPDRWWCCAVNNVTSWTPSAATQATTGRLLGTEGKITAARKFGTDQIVAYKDGAMYVGYYVGGTTVWNWRELPGYGCVGLDAVANLGTAHFVVGREGMYIFDGSVPQPIDEKVRDWFLRNSSATYRSRTIVTYDKEAERVWINFPSSGSSTGDPDMTLVYHTRTREWGRADRSIEHAFLFNTPSATFDGDTVTFDAAEGPFDAASPGSRILAVFDTSRVLSLMNASAVSSSFTLHEIGDEAQVTRLTEATLRYELAPTSASCQAYSSMSTGSGVSTGDMQSAHDAPSSSLNRFPLRNNGRFHRLKFSFTGNVKVSGYRPKLLPAGAR